MRAVRQVKKLRTLSAAAFSVAIVAVAIGTTAASGRAANPTYHGTLSGASASATIDIKLRDRKQNPLKVTINNFVLQCEDGTSSTRSGVFQGDVRDDGSFLVQTRQYSDTGQFYAEVTGKLKEKKAKGSFYMISNSFNPNIGPDCSTAHPQAWAALR